MNNDLRKQTRLVDLSRIEVKRDTNRKLINGVEHWWDPIKEEWREALYSPRSKKTEK